MTETRIITLVSCLMELLEEIRSVMRQINPRARPVVFGRKQGEGNTSLTADYHGFPGKY